MLSLITKKVAPLAFSKWCNVTKLRDYLALRDFKTDYVIDKTSLRRHTVAINESSLSDSIAGKMIINVK